MIVFPLYLPEGMSQLVLFSLTPFPSVISRGRSPLAEIYDRTALVVLKIGYTDVASQCFPVIYYKCQTCCFGTSWCAIQGYFEKYVPEQIIILTPTPYITAGHTVAGTSLFST